MSILNDIANPNIPNYLEGLRLMEGIETQRTNRRMAEIQAGRALQEMQMQREAQQRRQMGTEYIRQRLSRPDETQTQAISREGVGPPVKATTPDGKEILIPAEAPKPAKTIDVNPFNNFNKISTEQIKNAETYTDIADFLAANDDDRAKSFYDMGTKIMQAVRAESDSERKQALQTYEVMGNNFYKISKLEEQGKHSEAANLYEQTKMFLVQDPRFSGDPSVNKFVKSFPDYIPGLGKYVYSTTMSFKKAREQFQRELDKPLKTAQNVDDVSQGLYGKPYLKLSVLERQAVLEYLQKAKVKVSAVAGTGLKQEQRRTEKASNIMEMTQKAFDMATDWNTGLGSTFAYLPEFGLDAKNLAVVIDTIKANIGFEELNAMRAESKTGGALGQVTVRELELLQGTIAGLDQAQSKEQLQSHILKIQARYRAAKASYELMRNVNNAKEGETVTLPDGRKIKITDKSDPNGNYEFEWIQ